MNPGQEIYNNKSKELVFYLHVQYRCNSSWQGTLHWIDGRKTEVFRSTLELANLIESARQLSGGDLSGKGADVKWEEKEIVS